MRSLLPIKESAEFSIRKIADEITGQLFIMDHARMRMLERQITDRQLTLMYIGRRHGMSKNDVSLSNLRSREYLPSQRIQRNGVCWRICGIHS